MKSNKLRTCITYLFTFFLAFFLFVIALLTCLRFSVMSENFFLNSMDSVSYYEHTAVELTRLVKQQSRGAGFDSEYFAKIVEEEDIRDDMIEYEKNMLQGKQVTMDTKAFQAKLHDTINQYVDEKNIPVNSTVQVALDQFVNACSEKYVYMTQFPYIDVLGNVMNIFQKLYLIIVPVLSVISAILGVLLCRLQSARHRRRKYFGISLVGAGLLTSVAPAVLYAMRIFEKIALQPAYVYNLMVHLTKTVLISCMIVGLLMVAIGVIIAYLRTITRTKKSSGKERAYRSHHLEREE